ncbi:hypothetical protein EDB85DRAFT_1888161 [Lactarius pseudohatsudake]|nr:hypothetical protein EDB85DRAFT_1888161 [Lactarius pseudohatsudake]
MAMSGNWGSGMASAICVCSEGALFGTCGVAELREELEFITLLSGGSNEISFYCGELRLLATNALLRGSGFGPTVTSHSRPHPTALTRRLETTGRCSYPPPPPLPFVNLRPPLGVVNPGLYESGKRNTGPHPTVLNCRLETGRCSYPPPPPLPFVNLRPPLGVSRAQEPLAPARAFAGSLSLWTVLPPSMGKPLILATYLIRQPSLAGWRPRGDASTRGVASGRAPIYGAGLEDCILFLLPGMTLDSLGKPGTMLPSSPLHHWRVTVAAVIGIVQLALAGCPGCGRGILVGAVVRFTTTSPTSHHPTPSTSQVAPPLPVPEAYDNFTWVTSTAQAITNGQGEVVTFCEGTTRETWGRDRASNYLMFCSKKDIRAGRGWRRRVIGRQASNLPLGKAETRRPHLPRRRPHCCLAVTLPSPPPTSQLSPLHRITVAVMIGVARVALAECLGGGSGILMGVVVGYHTERRRQETLRRVEKLSFSQSIVTQIVERCRCDVVLDAFCDVASKHIVFAWT